MNREIRLPQSCPECGGEVTLRQEMLTFPGPVKTFVFCKNCWWKQQYIWGGDVEIEIDEIPETERENDRYNQEQDYLEEHLAEINRG